MHSLICLLALAPNAVPQIGDPAPDFALATIDGRQVVHGSLRGQVTAVEFFATWCGPCREGLDDLRAIREEIGDRVQILIIALDEPEKVRRFFEKNPPPRGAVWVLDPRADVARRWGEDRLPTTFFVDRKAIIRHINRGHGRGFRARATRWLRNLLKPAS